MSSAIANWKDRLARLSPGQRSKLRDRLDESGVNLSAEQPPLRLVAYFVKDPGHAEPGNSELRAHLEDKLPPAMLPAHFVCLERLPRTATGKLDRRALPAPDWGGSGSAEQPTPAANEYESALIAIWEEVLDVEPIGIQDNFFSMGGDSLLAIRIIARIRTAFATALTPREIFETPTLSDLAAIVAERSPRNDSYEEFEL